MQKAKTRKMILDFDDPQVFKLLVQVCSQYQVDPSVSLESEEFFRKLIAQYDGPSDKDSVTNWLAEQISQWFLALNERPKWIQSSEWPFIDGAPAIFVGQIDIAIQMNRVASKVFHDDTAFHIFVGEARQPFTIMQQY